VASPDIITLTDCIATLSRAGYTEQMDEVFREAVERGIVLGRNNNDLDEQWEIDLSGLPLPIARAAARYLLQSIVQKHRDGGTHKPDESNRLQDMIFITGIGKAQQKRRVESSSATPPAATPSNKVLERKDRTTSLREFIQAILETDFEPPLESIVPKRAQGTVVIEEAKLARWLNEERGRVVTAKSSARSD
jgi:pentatricopeptide repeat protein